MRNKPIQADQLIPTSATPPPEAGFYRIDRHTIGVVGNMSFRDPNTQVVMPVGKGAIAFPDFAPRLLASLVASSTAACTSGVVTVTATSHAIPATVFNGNEFYYPGSPSLAAGWYGGFSRTSADALTFSAQGAADFTSESVNAGAAFTSEVTIFSVTLPPNTLAPGDLLSCRMHRGSDAVASAHVVHMKIGTDLIARSSLSSASQNGVFTLSSAIVSNALITGTAGIEGSVSSTTYNVAFSTAAANTINITASVAAAGMYQRIAAAKLRVE